MGKMVPLFNTMAAENIDCVGKRNAIHPLSIN